MNNASVTPLINSSIFFDKTVNSEISSLTSKTTPVLGDYLLIEDTESGDTEKSITIGNLIHDTALSVTVGSTTNNVTISKHGFAPTAPNNATQFLDGTATYAQVTDADLSTSDITTNDVNSTRHGFAPKATTQALKLLNGSTTPAWSYSQGTSTTITDDYTITDTDGYSTILFNADKNVTATLPLLSNNIGRLLCFKMIKDGICTISRSGSGTETIEGVASRYIVGKDSYVILLGTETSWVTISQHMKFDTGWMRRSDWTSVNLGSIYLNFDNSSGTFLLGETIKEYSDSGMTTLTGCTGIIILAGASTNYLMSVTPNSATGNGFTNDYYLKGLTSNATAMVNVSTKNIDTYAYHAFGVEYSRCRATLVVSTNMTEETSNTFSNCALGPPASNIGVYFKGSTSARVQITTDSAGIYIINDSSVVTLVDTEDYYYKVIVEMT